MPTFSPALITVMRSVLEDAMSNVPAEQATTVTKAYLAEFIVLQHEDGVGADGRALAVRAVYFAALNQLPVILSKFM